MRLRRVLVFFAFALFAVPAAALATKTPDCMPAVATPIASEPTPLVLTPEELVAWEFADSDPEPELDACWGKIQPGSRMTAPVGCTMNWILVDESGALYIGTAGHCIGASGSNGRSVSIWGVGPVGVSVFNVNAGVGRDFGLVKIDPALYDRVDPTLCEWGGPTHVETRDEDGVLRKDRILLQYGFGFGFQASHVTRPRVIYTRDIGDSSITLYGTIASGDSGSPVMASDGGAAGVVTHAMTGVPGFVAAGPGYAQTLTRGIALAEAATGHTFSLVTSDVPVDFPAIDAPI